MISKMFTAIGNQRYDYKPRYYDPDKEALQERLDLKRRAKAGDKEAIKTQMRNSMRRQVDKKTASKHANNSNIMIMAIFAILLVMSVFALNVYLPEFLEVVLNK